MGKRAERTYIRDSTSAGSDKTAVLAGSITLQMG